MTPLDPSFATQPRRPAGCGHRSMIGSVARKHLCSNPIAQWCSIRHSVPKTATRVFASYFRACRETPYKQIPNKPTGSRPQNRLRSGGGFPCCPAPEQRCCKFLVPDPPASRFRNSIRQDRGPHRCHRAHSHQRHHFDEEQRVDVARGTPSARMV